MPTSPTDLAVIGAGPAGLAAAVTAADHGLSVALIDAGARPGGQYYRHPAPPPGTSTGTGTATETAAGAGQDPSPPEHPPPDWSFFLHWSRRLAAHRRTGRVRHLAGHHVWTVTRLPADAPAAFRVHTTLTDGAEPDATEPDDAGPAPHTDARVLLLATGAYERQLPFPGWTLPGVVGAGGAQAMLKSGLVPPGRRVVVAGSGPLTAATVASLLAAGVQVPALIEAAGYLRYGRRPRVLAANPGKLAEGARYGALLLRHGVRVLTGSAVLEAHGSHRVRAVTVAAVDGDWRPVPGTHRRIACDALAVGHGLVPQLELGTALGCRTRTTPDGAAALDVDGGLRTSVPGVWAAGETAGVGGAQLALTEGELAARTVAADLGAPGAHPALTARGPALRRRRERLRGFADAMARAHRPGPGWTGWLTDDTEVCRCEEVPAVRLREAVTALGARDVRTAKLLTRAGMGWCQGRMCAAAVAALTGSAGRDDPARRPLSCPVPLGELARLPLTGPPPDAEPR